MDKDPFSLNKRIPITDSNIKTHAKMSFKHKVQHYIININSMQNKSDKNNVSLKIVYYSIGFTESTSKFWRQINNSGGGG